MNGYDAVIFDSDGVLVEPPPVETQSKATRDAFQAVGIDDPDERHIEAVVDGVTVGGLHEICRAYDLDPETFWSAREHHDENSQLVEFRDGTRTVYDDVDAISDLSTRTDCGVVSNNHHSTITFVLEHFDLEPYFETSYGRPMTIESLGLKKPNPHYLERAIDDIAVETILYVGDSESDIVAADRAGIDSVFLRRSHSRDVELSVNPTYEVDGLHNVVGLADGKKS